MTRRPLASVLLLCAVALAPRPAPAQGEGGGRLPDSIAVVGVRRVSRQTVLLTAGLVPGRTANYRDIQHAIQALYASGQFDDIRIDQDTAGPGILIIQVKERPVVAHWTVRGVNRLSEHTVRDRAQVITGRPIDPAQVERARGRIDSLYKAEGYYLARVRALRVYDADSGSA